MNAPSCEGCGTTGHGIYVAGCRQCALRHLAGGPLFFESMRAGKLSKAYIEALRELGDPATVHLEVRAAAKKHRTGGCP